MVEPKEEQSFSFPVDSAPQVVNFDYGDTSLLKEARSNRAQQGVVLDAQAIGPGEVFNADLNHGSGGPQHAIGDFTYHCHIAEHYISGMWSFWRVFDTRQPDLAHAAFAAGVPVWAAAGVCSLPWWRSGDRSGATLADANCRSAGVRTATP